MFKRLFRRLTGGGARRLETERVRRERVIEAGDTDYVRWHSEASYNNTWSARLDAAMHLISRAHWIVDLGCGMQELRKRLPQAAIYLPMDLKPWTKETLFCDINAKRLPLDYILLCDLCVMMGVLEYVYDPQWLLSCLAENAEGIVLSYNAADTSAADRLGNGWVNAFTANQLLAMIESTSYRVVKTARYEDQMLIKAVNPEFDATRRARREACRRAYLSGGSTTAGHHPIEASQATETRRESELADPSGPGKADDTVGGVFAPIPPT